MLKKLVRMPRTGEASSYAAEYDINGVSVIKTLRLFGEGEALMVELTTAMLKGYTEAVADAAYTNETTA